MSAITIIAQIFTSLSHQKAWAAVLVKAWFCCCGFIVYCYSHCLWGCCIWALFSHAVHSALSSFAIILLKKRELVAFLELCYCYHVAVIVLYLFLMVPWVGLPPHCAMGWSALLMVPWVGLPSSWCHGLVCSV